MLTVLARNVQLGDSFDRNAITGLCDAIGGELTVVSPACAGDAANTTYVSPYPYAVCCSHRIPVTASEYVCVCVCPMRAAAVAASHCSATSAS